MARKTKLEKDLIKKTQRRKEETLLNITNWNLSSPVSPKKPIEHSFDKNDPESFRRVTELGNTIAEIKRDGYGVKIIINRKSDNPIRLFSISGNEWNLQCFPELIPDLNKYPNGYFHGEIFGRHPDGVEVFSSLDEFTAIQKRPKNNPDSLTPEMLENYPLRIEIFDVLSMHDKPLLLTRLRERRRLLEENLPQTKHVGLIKQWEISCHIALHKIFIWAINNKKEGLIAKDPDSYYVPGSRDNDQIKLKEFLTVDLAVLGFYETESSITAGKPFSAILVGSFNEKTGRLETMAKVKVSKKTDQSLIMKYVKKLVTTDESLEKAQGANTLIELNPGITFKKDKLPIQICVFGPDDILPIVELQTQNVTFSENWHSCGFDNETGKAHSLRIPTFKQVRDDKCHIIDVTTTKQIQKLFFE